MVNFISSLLSILALCLLLALGLAVVVWLFRRPLVRFFVNRRLGPAKRSVNDVSVDGRRHLEGRRRVAVIGGGLAGITSAITLKERGFEVVLHEAKPHLGGKIGAHPVTLGDSGSVFVGHGFHAFFRHYHNLNRLFERLGLTSLFRSIEDYVILERDGGRMSFAGLDATPILNLLSLRSRGVFGVRDVLLGPARDLMGIFLEFDRDRTFESFDDISYACFADDAKLPKRLRLSFGTFARAFFSDEERMSLAELIKAFHFYFLSHDGGLIYDFPAGDYEHALLAPIRERLSSLGVSLRLGCPVKRLAKRGDAFVVDDETFDAVILATDVVGARRIAESSEGMEDAPPFELLKRLRPGQRYAVLRLWLDSAFDPELPDFVITERDLFLDAIAIVHRHEPDARTWADENRGSVIELHAYAVPEEAPDDRAIRDGLVAEFMGYFASLRTAKILHEHLEVSQDFPAFHTGLWKERPTTESGVDGLYFAGDWVKLHFPAMLLEAAVSAGLMAANRILAREGLSEEPVFSVPERGVMAKMPWPPGRKAWHERRTRQGTSKPPSSSKIA